MIEAPLHANCTFALLILIVGSFIKYHFRHYTDGANGIKHQQLIITIHDHATLRILRDEFSMNLNCAVYFPIRSNWFLNRMISKVGKLFPYPTKTSLTACFVIFVVVAYKKRH